MLPTTTTTAAPLLHRNFSYFQIRGTGCIHRLGAKATAGALVDDATAGRGRLEGLIGGGGEGRKLQLMPQFRRVKKTTKKKQQQHRRTVCETKATKIHNWCQTR